VYLTTIDQCGPGTAGTNAHFDISPEAFKELFGDAGVAAGTMIADWSVVASSNCKGQPGYNAPATTTPATTAQSTTTTTTPATTTPATPTPATTTPATTTPVTTTPVTTTTTNTPSISTSIVPA